MAWEIKADRPVYTQLLEQIQMRIISGEYPEGSRLPSVRDMAAEAAVNPNTMQKALSELERSGMVYSKRTSGRFITEDTNIIKETKKSIAREKIFEFIESMKKLDIGIEEIIEYIKNVNSK